MRWAWMRWSEWLSTRAFCLGLSFRANDGFRFTTVLFVQLPGMDCFSASVSREARAYLFLCLVESFFGVHSGAVGLVIRFLDLLGDERCLWGGHWRRWRLVVTRVGS